MFASGPGINPIPIIISIPVSLVVALYTEKYLSVSFAEKVIKLRKYPFKNYFVSFSFNVFAIVISILSVPVFHKYMNLAFELPLVHVNVNDALTGAVIIAAWVLPRFIYSKIYYKSLNEKEHAKVLSAIIFNAILMFFTFALCLIVVGNVYRALLL